MMRNRSLLRAVLAAACLVAGCTILEMKEDVDKGQQQVRDKELELQKAQQTQTGLQAEHRRLVEDLRTRELTVGELTMRLQEMQRLNAGSLAVTQEQQQKKTLRTKQLSEAASQVKGLKVLEQDSTLTQDAKAKRLEAGRQQLRKMLELLVVT